MFVLMKFAQPIPEEIRITLQAMYMNHPTFRCRQRAQAILLSVRALGHFKPFLATQSVDSE